MSEQVVYVDLPLFFRLFEFGQHICQVVSSAHLQAVLQVRQLQELVDCVRLSFKLDEGVQLSKVQEQFWRLVAFSQLF